jgi:cell division protease FtsH
MNSILQKFSMSSPSVKVEEKEPSRVSYSEMLRGISGGKVKQVYIPSTQTGLAIFVDEEGGVASTQFVQNQELWRILSQSEADVEVFEPPETNIDFMTVFWVILLISFIFRSLFGGMQMGVPMMPNNFGVANEVETRFTDVEGIDGAKVELEEIVDFLKNPESYAASGARVPRGALLTGPPGCGKTLLAKAIAGEAQCPFIHCSGSNFVEMFVGVGAKRIRDLFEVARQNQPCIIFIDEIDAIAKKRSASAFGNDEREQTINQLLVEMDGFDTQTEVIVLAATNRADTLDEAVLRPGRFDRKIQVSLPGRDGRERILGVHSRDKNLAPEVNLADWAQCTTGFSGADLANLMNECAIRSVRDKKGGIIDNSVLEEVYQRTIIGAKGDTIFSTEKKDLVAYHEAGHALVGVLCREYDELRKVSIIPRGDAGGVTFFAPREEGILNTKSYYIAQIKVLLGGRACEELVYGSSGVTTGASQDLKMVNKLVREMVTAWGFGETKFAVDYNDMSVLSSRQIDREVNAIIDDCYTDVYRLLDIHRVEVEILKQKLVSDEIVDGQFVRNLIESKDKFCNLDVI